MLMRSPRRCRTPTIVRKTWVRRMSPNRLNNLSIRAGQLQPLLSSVIGSDTCHSSRHSAKRQPRLDAERGQRTFPSVRTA